MPVSIIRSTEAKEPSLVLCLYGQGGIGKTTLATTAPKPILIDSEGGSKALGARGIDVPVIHVKTWQDVREAWALVKPSSEYETVVIDPVGAFLDQCVEEVRAGTDMNLKKWGEVKDRMKKFIWDVKNSGKHVVFVAHEDKEKDDEAQLRKPLLKSNLADELINLCDVVGHLRVDANDGKRKLRVQPEAKYQAKDRFDALGQLIEEPNITTMIAKIHAAYNKPPFEDKSESDHAKKMKDALAKAKMV